MLNTLGLKSVDDLFSMIPAKLKNPPIEFPPALTEMEIQSLMESVAAQNRGAQCLSFLGGGAYQHFIPQAVFALISRGDFSTAYTPYQPEVSQGTLQAIFEFQTMISRLTGMSAANAGVYDGATALAESALMACRATRKEKVLVARTVNPHYRRVMRTYLSAPGVEIVEIPARDGAVDLEALKAALDDDTAAFFIQQPNYFGVLEPVDSLAPLFEGKKALLGAAAYPHSLGVLKTPGAWGAQIVCGDLQSVGIPLSFGGPYSGFMACREDLVRHLPGRIVGQAKDADGRDGYVLTLQTREQHIRRAKATSNICTNQALCALSATIFLAMMGPRGLRGAAAQSVRQAHKLYDALCSIEGVKPMFGQPFYNEFALELPAPAAAVIAEAKKDGVLPGIHLKAGEACDGEGLLVCATELTSDADVARCKEALKNAIDHVKTHAVV